MQLTTHTNFQSKAKTFEVACGIWMPNRPFQISARIPVDLFIIYEMKFYTILDPQGVLLLTAVGWNSHIHLLY